MAENTSSAVKVEHYMTAPTKHTLKSASLLFTPPSWILRGPIHVIFVIAFVALLYSFWATVDQLVSAPLLLQREANTVQSVGAGMVTEVAAKANELVRFGQPLITVQEQTRISSDSEQSVLEGRIFETRRKLDEVKSNYEHKLSQIKLDLEDLTNNFDAKKIAAQGKVSQIEQQQSIAVRAQSRIVERLDLARKEFARQKSLFDSKDITVREFEGAQQRVLELEKDLDDAKSQIATAGVSLATAREELSNLMSQRQKDKLLGNLHQTEEQRDRDLKDLQDRIESSTTKMSKGQQLVEGVTFDQDLTHYKSINAGLVTDVLVKPGQMIAAGMPLVSIVRETAPLEARILVRNQDIGHLKRGQEVKIKYFAYPYQEFGIQRGNITEISTKPGGVTGAESMYIVKVALEHETIAKRSDKQKQLEIGLEGFAEVKTGVKHLIEIVFSPVSRFFEPAE